jgi:hypothetical protein
MHLFDATSPCLAAGRQLAPPPTPPPRIWLEELVAALPINPATADLAVKYSEITASRKSLARKPSFLAQGRGQNSNFAGPFVVDK